MDRLSTEARSALMARVRSRNTSPEIAVRRLLHSMGYRFRLHRKNLPGSPDLILPKYMIAIFVHGCFWHRHAGCRRCSTPRSNVEFWEEKFRRNVARDARNTQLLGELGWRTVIVWECETKSVSYLRQKLGELLEEGKDERYDIF
ncbi:very short patch repair endonuclease [Azospirillum sp. Marseille-Q6669]